MEHSPSRHGHTEDFWPTEYGSRSVIILIFYSVRYVCFTVEFPKNAN